MKRIWILSAVLVAALSASEFPAQDEVDGLQYARGAALWILSVSRNEGGIRTWPVNDTDKKEPVWSLYHGMPGGILLFAELAKEDPNGSFREAVASSVAGLESLRLSEGDKKVWGYRDKERLATPIGLYTGCAGVAWLYLELHRLTGEVRYREKARETTDFILSVLEREKDSPWNDSADIISGAAGVGLYLLRAALVFRDARCLTAAMSAGDYLISKGIQTPSGLKWKMNAASPRLYPNFSHGTSGVAFFLALLHSATGQMRFLNAAIRGAREMQTIAEREGQGCTWYHHEGDGENLWYVSWCHGPAGTARLFYALASVTRNRSWLEWVTDSASWLLASGIPNPPKPINGYWNEGVCCGTAGIGDFYVDLYRTTKKIEYLRAAESMAAHLVKAADRAGGGFRWDQAENRISPDQKDAQTGYAQGAAGFGLFFLKLHRVRNGAQVGWYLPDNPF